MARRFAMTLVLTLALGFVSSAGAETKLLRYPDIHDGLIVFSYAGDLYTVSDRGGVASRLTSDQPGLEIYPKFSESGAKVAFIGQYEDGGSVYVVDTGGGTPTRLSYRGYRTRVVEWTPDRRVLFTARDQAPHPGQARYFAVPMGGGYPEPFPFPTGAAASYSPDGGKLAYNRFDRDRRSWKRYKGGLAQDVWVYDFEKNKTERLTDWAGTDSFPMWSGGTIYFLSDRDFTLNLYALDVNTRAVRKVTDHDAYDVKWPSMGPGQIVYENGGSLWVLDLKTEKTRELSVTVPADKLAARPRWVNLGGAFDWASLSPSGKRVLTGARGEVFTVPAEKGQTRNLTRTSGVRESGPVWSPDGEWIAYLSDETGEMEVYVRPGDGTGEARRVTRGGKVYRFGLQWSPDSKKLLFGDKDQKLYWMNVRDGVPHKIDRGVYTEIRQYDWSPDSKWVAYQINGANRYGSIRVYSLALRRSFPVTGGATDDSAPVFDPGGKYLYFFSDRDTKPFLDVTDATYILQDIRRPYAAVLSRDDPSPFAPESDEEAADEKEEDEDDKDEEKDETPDVDLDTGGLGDRVVAFPIKPDNYAALSANEGHIFYLASPNRPLGGTWDAPDRSATLHRFSLEDREAKTVMKKVDGYALSADGEKLLYAAKGKLGIIDASADGQSPGEGGVDLSHMEMHLDPVAEWEQIFFEAWRWQRDFFYDPGLHGVDWKAVRDKYARLLPWVAHRDDLNYLLAEMIGELNVSHAYVWGGDYGHVPHGAVGVLGADLVPDEKAGRYRIDRILPPDPWHLADGAPLAAPGVDVKEGEYLLAIDGRELTTGDNPWALFQRTAGRQVRLKVGEKASGRDARTVVVETLGDEQFLRYRAWVDANREYVAEKTGGRIGYVHIPDMSADGLREFSRAFSAQIDKQGLVVDVRFNRGGFVSEMILEKLRRELITMFSARNADDMTYPWQVVHGPMVCITNQMAGSDGDIFPYFFRQYGLGKVVGMRTWGGVVGIRPDKRLVDGGMLTMPEYGTFSLDRKWIIEGHGVDPDIEVDLLTEDVIADEDPQLDKAIEVILDELESGDYERPERPGAYPRPNER